MSNRNEVIPCVPGDRIKHVMHHYHAFDIPGMHDVGGWIPYNEKNLNNIIYACFSDSPRFTARFQQEKMAVALEHSEIDNANYHRFCTYTILHYGADLIASYSLDHSLQGDGEPRSIGIGSGVVAPAEKWKDLFSDHMYMLSYAAKEVNNSVFFGKDFSDQEIEEGLEYLGFLCLPADSPNVANSVCIVCEIDIEKISHFLNYPINLLSIKGREGYIEDLKFEKHKDLVNSSYKFDNWSEYLLTYIIQPVHTHKLFGYRQRD